MKSKRATANSKPARISEVALVLAILSLWSVLWIWFCSACGYLSYYGDAEAHLNIARRILDSRTPGYDQLGTVWLPLPHLLLLPLAKINRLWQTAWAGSIVSGICFVLSGAFLFAAARRAFGEQAAAIAAVAVFAFNPNLMYLQTTAMTEPVFLAAFLATIYFAVLFQSTQSWFAVAGAGLAALCGTLSRYEGWFLIPFVALFILLTAQRSRLAKATLFAAIAGLGPLYWLGHDWWCCSSVLAFYNGPYSAKTIQGAAKYPGNHNWHQALIYFAAAARLCAGTPLFWVGAAGLAACLAIRNARWPALLLCLPGIFYMWSIHSSGTPIFVPSLWPNTYYNTRYGLVLLPALVFGAAALVALAPQHVRKPAVGGIFAIALIPWLLHPSPAAWITWKESQVNSEGRRAWTKLAADYLAPRYKPGTGIVTTFGDVTGVYRRLGLPLRETLTWDNWPQWPAAVARPDLFMREEWAVVMGGDPVQSAILHAGLHGPRYQLVRVITVPNAPAIEIYHCCIGLTPVHPDVNSIHQSTRSQERLPVDEEE